MNEPEPDVALRAVALMELGRLDESERMARRVLASDSNSYVALYTLAAINMQRLDASGLMNASRRLIAAHPNRWEGYWLLCTALNYDRQWDEAIEAAERAVALAPEQPSAFHELARALSGSPGRIVDAIQAAEEGTRLGPDQVWSWVLLSGVCRVAGQFAEAVSAAKRALSIEPNSVMARVLLGVAYLSNGEHAAATDQFRAALRQEPIPYTFSAVEETLLDHAVPAATRPLYEQVRLALGHPDLTDPAVTATDPALLRLRVAYGHAQATRGDLERASEVVASLLRDVPEHQPARTLAASLAERSGDLSEAAQWAEELLAEGVRGPMLHHVRTRSLQRLGRDTEALGALTDAVAAYPRLAEFPMRRAEVLTTLGRAGEAREAVAQAIELDPAVKPSTGNERGREVGTALPECQCR